MDDKTLANSCWVNEEMTQKLSFTLSERLVTEEVKTIENNFVLPPSMYPLPPQSETHLRALLEVEDVSISVPRARILLVSLLLLGFGRVPRFVFLGSEAVVLFAKSMVWRNVSVTGACKISSSRNFVCWLR